MFQMAVVNFGLPPSEFWEMTMNEWFALHEVHRPNDYAGKLTHDRVDDLLDDIELSDQEWWAKHGSTRNQS